LKELSGFWCPTCRREVIARKLGRRERRETRSAWTPSGGLLEWLFTPHYGWRCTICGSQVARRPGRMPSAVPAGAAAGTNTATIYLHAVDDKIAAIKALRAVTNGSLSSAKDAIDHAPCPLGALPRDIAVQLADRLCAAGATVELID
jgi:ribosomal protein L7/L12